MSDITNADARRGLTVDPPPRHASKDVQGSDNPIPLSPQWLISKAVDSKELGPNHENKLDAAKASGIGEDLSSIGKRKDVFRPIVHDPESGRRDHWHDEERETNSAIRRDRWREGDKESGDTRRIERWSDNISRHPVDSRRPPTERWNDSGSKEIDQRRESKWNTRWGPGDKESDSWREKWMDTSKGGNATPEKGASYFSNHGKDINNHGKDTEGDDHYSRSWRSNYALGRGRGDSSHHPSQTPVKPLNTHGYSRGRTESEVSPASITRGRFNSSMSGTSNDSSRFHHLGFLHEKADDTSGDLSSFRYTRMKMLDIYRRTDIKSVRLSSDDFIEVPSLTQVEALEPLAFSAPAPDESVIIKGIEKGEIVSSGAPQLSKESSIGRNNLDARVVKSGSKHDLPAAEDIYRDDNINNTKAENFGPLESPAYEKQYYQLGQYSKLDTTVNSSSFHPNKVNVKELGFNPSAGEIITKDSTRLESSLQYAAPRRCQPEDGPTELDTRLSLLQKGMEANHKIPITSSFFRDDNRWQNVEGIGFQSDPKSESYIRRQSSEVMKEGDPFISKDGLIARKLQPPSPEDLSLYYKDPQGQIQGPFSGTDVIAWYDAGYFGLDLQVRVVNAPADAPFLSLGDAMPHLKMKARPPPGFGVAKQGAALDESLRGKFVNPGSIQTGLGEHDILMSGQRNMSDGLTEKQNRYLESLMSTNMTSSTSDNFSFNRGMQEFGGISTRLPSVGESGNDANYLLAQARLLERQRSLLNPHSYWSSGDVSSVASKTDMISDSSVPHSKLVSSTVDPSLQILQPQQVDLLSLLHAGADKIPRSVSSGPSGVPFHSNILDAPIVNNPTHAGTEFSAEVLNMHYNQHVPSQIRLGAQQQGLQSTNQPPLPHLISQHTDHTSCLVPPDKLISSEVNQDPRLQSLLQQQYLLSQLPLQSQIPAAQFPVLEKLLLLQQQQKQEQHQLLLQQQQQMLSKLLSGHQSNQQFVDPSYGQTPAAMSAGHAALDNLVLQRVNEQFQINQQMLAPHEHTAHSSNYPNLNLQGNLNASSVSSGAPSLHLPHQIFDQAACLKESDTQPRVDNDGTHNPDSETKPVMADGMTFTQDMVKPGELFLDPRKTSQSLDDGETGHKSSSISQGEELPQVGPEAISHLESSNLDQVHDDFISSNSDQVHDANTPSLDLSDNNHANLSSNKEVVADLQEVKKASEKKSKKQKKSKTKLVSDTGKVLPKTVPNNKPNQEIVTVGLNANETKTEVRTDTEESIWGPSFGGGGEISISSSAEPYESQKFQSSSENLRTSGSKDEGEAESGLIGKQASNPKTTSAVGAWKSAPGFKPKSFLEIQQEEQLRVQREISRPEIVPTGASARNPSPAPWSGIVTNVENKLNGDAILEASSTPLVNSEATLKSKSKKSQLHDLLAEEVLAKSYKEDTESSTNNAHSTMLRPPSPGGANVDISVDLDEFVEAKDTRKARKKASKSKASGVKIPQPVVPTEPSASPSPSPVDKAKSTRQAQEKDSLPAPPVGPSLGDFVIWKGDQASTVPPPAWSMDSRKVQKPTSLRDILLEQEKRSGVTQQQVPIPSPAKLQPNQASRGGGPSWQLSGSSPSKTPSLNSVPPVSAQTKSRVEDDLFWGPPEQSKSETRKFDFPPTENSISWGIKGSSSKGITGSGSGQKPTGSRRVDHSLSSTLGSSLSVSKSQNKSGVKNSEALEFREWCANEWSQLTGTNDTSFLEFCIKQSTSEAEMLLRENLGPLDPNHEFIDKFLSYKEFLSADVVEMAFQSQKSRYMSVETVNNRNPKAAAAAAAAAVIDADEGVVEDGDGVPKGRGKKKGKKVQKVNPLLLGFNVVSNRIMMGEIQSVEE